MPETVDVTRANREAERHRILTLLSAGAENELQVSELCDMVAESASDPSAADPFVLLFMELDVSTVLELVRDGDGAPALERVAARYAEERYYKPDAIHVRGRTQEPQAQRRAPLVGIHAVAAAGAAAYAQSRAEAKKKASKKKASKKASKKKAPKKAAKRRPRQQNLPNTREPRIKPETVAFDRQVAKIVGDAGEEGVGNEQLRAALECSKGKLRLSLQRLKEQSYVAQNGSRRTARYIATPEGLAFAAQPSATDQKEASP